VVERWFGVLNTFYFCIAAGYGSMGQPIKSAGGYDDNIITKGATEAEQCSEENQC